MPSAAGKRIRRCRRRAPSFLLRTHRCADLSSIQAQVLPAGRMQLLQELVKKSLLDSFKNV